MREFLVTKFVCSACGRNLKLTYDIPQRFGQYAEGEPTGAEMVQQAVSIEPCECQTNQIREIRRAASVLFELKEPPR